MCYDWSETDAMMKGSSCTGFAETETLLMQVTCKKYRGGILRTHGIPRICSRGLWYRESKVVQQKCTPCYDRTTVRNASYLDVETERAAPSYALCGRLFTRDYLNLNTFWSQLQPWGVTM
mmetsp:Transcript_47504/g.97104  ORF Transcript_47504/g.97104 Transcript_47504/m.97104 type:complete len:120 (+) Transcript_47504:422-781(+)